MAIHSVSMRAVPAAAPAVHPHLPGCARASLPAERAVGDWTDGELVGLALAGRPGAFGGLLARHGEHLRRVIARRLRRPEDVHDVLQDTQITAWRALHRYDPTRPLQAWLTSIAVNKCRDWGRRRSVRARLLLHERERATLDAAQLRAASPEHLLIDRESTHALGQALAGLPQSLREPLVLTALRGLSNAAAGEELGITSKAIENRVRRARALLTQALAAGAL